MKIHRRIRKFMWKTSMIGLSRGAHVTRYYMYDRLGAIGRLLPNKTGRVLCVSHSSNLCDLLGLRPTQIVDANYPDHDMLNMKFEDASYDFVLSDQVLEHLEGSPQQAINECYRILKPGGVAVHTTCFINPIHCSPQDFWRFTPEALRLLHIKWSKIIESGGWGNLDALSAVQDGLRFEGVPHAKWHPYHQLATKNDPCWPIVTWIVAQKSDTDLQVPSSERHQRHQHCH